MIQNRFVQVKVDAAGAALRASAHFAEANGKKTIALETIVKLVERRHAKAPFEKAPPEDRSTLQRWFQGDTKKGVPRDIWNFIETLLGVPENSLCTHQTRLPQADESTRRTATSTALARNLANLQVAMYPRKSNSLSMSPDVEQTISIETTAYFGPALNDWTDHVNGRTYSGSVQIRSASLQLHLAASAIVDGTDFLGEVGIATINGKTINCMGPGSDGVACAWNINADESGKNLAGKLRLGEICSVEGRMHPEDRVTISVQPNGLDVTNVRVDHGEVDGTNEIRSQIRRRLLEKALRKSLEAEDGTDTILCQANLWELT
ncbi:hypothetical protein [Rhizobium johnstonii]|uniref:hypothetical protein n=1 Tax=Rhizobium johnstonii TaxID=3019933 RepID=UPI003F9BEF89